MTQRHICNRGTGVTGWLGARSGKAAVLVAVRVAVRVAVLVAVLVVVASQSATHAATAAAVTRQSAGGGHEYRELRTVEGRLRYALALPDGFDRSKTYPVLLAFPPGPQTEPMVDAGFGRYWGPHPHLPGGLSAFARRETE